MQPAGRTGLGLALRVVDDRVHCRSWSERPSERRNSDTAANRTGTKKTTQDSFATYICVPHSVLLGIVPAEPGAGGREGCPTEHLHRSPVTRHRPRTGTGGLPGAGRKVPRPGSFLRRPVCTKVVTPVSSKALLKARNVRGSMLVISPAEAREMLLGFFHQKHAVGPECRSARRCRSSDRERNPIKTTRGLELPRLARGCSARAGLSRHSSFCCNRLRRPCEDAENVQKIRVRIRQPHSSRSVVCGYRLPPRHAAGPRAAELTPRISSPCLVAGCTLSAKISCENSNFVSRFLFHFWFVLE